MACKRARGEGRRARDLWRAVVPRWRCGWGVTTDGRKRCENATVDVKCQCLLDVAVVSTRADGKNMYFFTGTIFI